MEQGLFVYWASCNVASESWEGRPFGKDLDSPGSKGQGRSWVVSSDPALDGTVSFSLNSIGYKVTPAAKRET